MKLTLSVSLVVSLFDILVVTHKVMTIVKKDWIHQRGIKVELSGYKQDIDILKLDNRLMLFLPSRMKIPF